MVLLPNSSQLALNWRHFNKAGRSLALKIHAYLIKTYLNNSAKYVSWDVAGRSSTLVAIVGETEVLL